MLLVFGRGCWLGVVTGVWRARANGTRGFVVMTVSCIGDDPRCILDEVMSGRGRSGAAERRLCRRVAWKKHGCGPVSEANDCSFISGSDIVLYKYR